jgi:hypothetical protein
MFWLILFITYIIGMPVSAIIFDNNHINPSVLPIFIAFTPFVNFIFVIAMLIKEIIRYFDSGDANEDTQKIRELFEK